MLRAFQLVIINLARLARQGKLVFTHAQTQRKEYQVCVDSGSEVSIITQEIYNELKASLYPYRGPGAESASNNQLEPAGECDLLMTLKASDYVAENCRRKIFYLQRKHKKSCHIKREKDREKINTATDESTNENENY